MRRSACALLGGANPDYIHACRVSAVKLRDSLVTRAARCPTPRRRGKGYVLVKQRERPDRAVDPHYGIAYLGERMEQARRRRDRRQARLGHGSGGSLRRDTGVDQCAGAGCDPAPICGSGRPGLRRTSDEARPPASGRIASRPPRQAFVVGSALGCDDTPGGVKMGFEQYHEPPGELSAEVRTFALSRLEGCARRARPSRCASARVSARPPPPRLRARPDRGGQDPECA